MLVRDILATAQHSTAQHSTAQHSTAQHSTAQHSTRLTALFCHTLNSIKAITLVTMI